MREREREDGSKVKQKVARLLVTKFDFYSLLEIPLVLLHSLKLTTIIFSNNARSTLRKLSKTNKQLSSSHQISSFDLSTLFARLDSNLMANSSRYKVGIVFLKK